MYKPSKLLILKFLIVGSIFLFFTFGFVEKLGLYKGLHVVLLIWTFFVLCMPTTNGGVIIDIPYYIFSGKKPLYSEMLIWFIALAINFYSFVWTPQIYFSNIITHLLFEILSKPWPRWIIIIFCFFGTFYTIRVSDASGRISNPFHRIFSIALSILSLALTISLTYSEFIIMLTTHGNL